ncbi:hypothetical protein JY651_02065 [Pyxidicoccus parkwayensis]|uniref:Lipoprotein n=1 Tax=Pyxidicoccus parkwayensis TaxID=2813578 RepID=A0ABX7NXZ5_9BACT|nr:hypothetical protein [Pyxidicoccus parkwaysis]QSQ23792.1 hypothetical protein JY651_02065 [Pyxidicoccus parkwaysis]
MRSMMRSLIVASFSLVAMTACGPASESDVAEAPGEASQVEQEIGTTPDCGSGSLQEQVTWKLTCGACSEVGGDGSWNNGDYGRGGSLYQRCCTSGGTCGGWKLIRPVCTTC